MEGYDVATYGQRIADVYDERTKGARPEQVELLYELAGDGPVLELGIGTGRLALPLAARGVDVHGIDSSEAMVAKLAGEGVSGRDRARPFAEHRPLIKNNPVRLPRHGHVTGRGGRGPSQAQQRRTRARDRRVPVSRPSRPARRVLGG